MNISMYKKGFTLVELLVVISVITLLSSVVLSSLNAARAKSRDGKRMQDLVQMRTALELYAQDHGGLYPINTYANGDEYDGGWLGTTPGCSGYTVGTTIPANGLVPQYISQLPQDPKPTVATNRCYYYFSTGTDYSFWVYETVESINSTQSPPHPLRYVKSTLFTKSLAVFTPGGSQF